MKKSKLMKAICGILVTITILIGVSCSNNGENDIISDSKTRSENVKYTNLLSDLNAVNDSIKSIHENELEPQGWGWLLKIFRVVESDVKGAFVGFQLGAAVHWLVGAVGAVVGGALFSIGTDLQNKAPALESIDLNRTRFELICQYVLSDKELLQTTYDEYDDVSLNFGNKYDNLMIIGASHNACLKLYIGDKKMYYPKDLDDEDVQKSLQLFDSSLYNNFYNDFIINSKSILSNTLCNSNEYFRDFKNASNIINYEIIDLFNEGLEYCNNMTDVNSLVNSYFKIIEDNDELLNEEKIGLYCGLITGAYSASFWLKNSSSSTDTIM
ncbi:MAG: hypothetical protein HDS71_04305 [Bacteroidales bacterium]|nr:hypothetical protein [Bacteroidales bacterium]MBD5205766.1 hypothetical protein [Bacteroidales bacterium]MBD5223258.1 hypothetical protein [Bacteroidales bacterium]MBD5302916.1 hypothetical protein [Bacteroides sp.]